MRRAAESEARVAPAMEVGEIDEAWESLPRAVREGILAMVRASKER